MAPALTEPLSPTENLNSSTVKASTTPTTRSSKKLETSIANKSGTSSTTNISVAKSVPQIREKRNRSGGITINPTPTSSKRITRFRDKIHRNSFTLNASINGDNTSELQENTTSRKHSKAVSVHEVNSSTSSSVKNNSLDTKNEQMGLSTAPLNNKNKIINNINNKNSSKNLDTIDNNTKDSSTAQLLADLTNEAITAEICLRNQLKDVNLVKTSGEHSSSVIQQDTFVNTDTAIVVLKVPSPIVATESEINKTTIAHMEAQFDEAKTSNFLDTTLNREVEEDISRKLAEKFVSTKEIKGNLKEKESLKSEVITKDKCHNDENKQRKAKSVEAVENEIYAELDKRSADSPQTFIDAPETKKTVSKLEILSVQELPPVSTDSTMTASEVEDNIEERLSQLDGTAIDSPPPNNRDIDSNNKSCQNYVADDTQLHTPTHRQTSTDLQELQDQLQQTPPSPINRQDHSPQLQLQQQPQQTICYNSPQSTSSINVLSNVGGNMPQPYIKESDNVVVGGAAELEDQDIEEVFKVLKGFEGGTTSDLNVCDLNVLFNEVYMKINETELNGNTGSSGSIASGICSNIQSHVTHINPSIQLVKPTKTEEGQIEIEKHQLQMQRKIDFLMRRLRKLQARYMCKHTSEEIAGLFEWSARQASKGITNTTSLQHNENTSASDPSKCFLKVIAARPPASDWKDVHEALVPANQISTLLRKIECVANAQQLCTVSSTNLINITHKKTKKALMEAQVVASAGVVTNSSTKNSSIINESKAEEVVVATLDENITDELSQVAGLLQIEMSEAQKAIDSDATESSSGGESADEMVTYNNTQQQTLPITKRAAWRYSRDRAAIASRWSWLLSQISDLEIKIRQHSELHQEIVRSKGPVTCGSQIDTKNTANEQVNEDPTGSCRTRGYIPSLFRKRKLIQTTNIHTISKKAARPSTIKCGCQWPLQPCALCTGRLDPTAPRDLPDTMMMSDRIALLDSGYHPVLSFKENVNNALHFEAIAKQPEWQQRVMRCQAKNIAKNVWRAEREAVAAAAGGYHTPLSKKFSDAPPTKRRYVKKKDRLNNDEKTGGKGYTTTTGSQQQHAVPYKSESAVTAKVTSLTSTTSLNDIGNGTSTLSTTTSTTPLVANKGMSKGMKKQHCSITMDDTLRDPSNPLQPPKCLSTTSYTATFSSITTTTISNKKYIHQTSDCLPTNYDQFNLNQTPLSLISNSHNHNNSSKNNKHRKLPSSAVVNTHHYNHPHNSSNNLYNGDSGYMFSHDYWGGSGENFNVRSRTSSPTHGSIGSFYHKYESPLRSLDRKNRTSYDIDNIVIPYSVAAATRVEVLPYKEIPTPKWRIIEIPLDAKPVTNGHDSDGKLLEQTKSNQTDTGRKSTNSKDNEVHIVKDIKDNVKTLMGETKENVTYFATATPTYNDKIAQMEEKRKEEYQARSDYYIKNNQVDEVNKEPELKKLKMELNVIGDRNESSENETEIEYNEGKITLQNVSEENNDEDEDISDDAMFLRHERALTEERRKFQTYLKFPWSTRSRANRRIDSRAESSGPNTPDPSSPAPQTPSAGGGDLDSIPSPLNPATPLNPLDTISEAGDYSTSFLGINSLPSLSSKRCERRRTTSTKRDREVERRSSTPDSKELIPPYEPLTFPLTNTQFEELMRVMPSDHSEDSKRFDECYLPGSSGGFIGLRGFPLNKYSRTVSGSTSKRSSRSSTLCGDTTMTPVGGSCSRRVKCSNLKNLRPISADDSNVDDMLFYDDDYDDDYPKHHLTPSDNHLTADSVRVGDIAASNGLYVDDDDDVYGGLYVGRQQHKQRGDSEEDSEEEPFQDDDPNDPEWRGEVEERLRKKV